MVSRVSVNVIAICMVSAVIAVGVVPDSKSSALVRWWYSTCMFNATHKVFLYFFEPVEIIPLTLAPWVSSSLGLLYLKKSSLAVADRVYFRAGAGVVFHINLYRRHPQGISQQTHQGNLNFLPWLPSQDLLIFVNKRTAFSLPGIF